MKTGTIHQEVFFKTSPSEAYELFMDAEKHGDFTGSEVEISRDINGIFTVFDGYCHGFNKELEEGRKIVQAWHFEEDGWPEDHYSICTFVFTGEKGGTSLSFTQTDIPEHKVAALASGWEDFYWKPIREYLAGN